MCINVINVQTYSQICNWLLTCNLTDIKHDLDQSLVTIKICRHTWLQQAAVGYVCFPRLCTICLSKVAILATFETWTQRGPRLQSFATRGFWPNRGGRLWPIATKCVAGLGLPPWPPYPIRLIFLSKFLFNGFHFPPHPQFGFVKPLLILRAISQLVLIFSHSLPTVLLS